MSGRTVSGRMLCAQIVREQIICSLESFVSKTPIHLWGQQ